MKKDLRTLALDIRIDLLKTLLHRGYGHLGGAMSIVELLTVLYGEQMRVDPENPHWSERDYLVLSKGHAGPAVYSALANVGFFPKAWLETLNEGGTRLPSHLDRLKTPGVDATTGSLGQGTSIAAGIALALRKQKRQQMVYLVVGDGELNEGQCWEAFQFIAGQKISECLVIIDENMGQNDGNCDAILPHFDISKKMEAFGFQTQIVDGRSVEAISRAIDQAKLRENAAQCLVLKTVKGQGDPFFETYAGNHSVKFQSDEVIQAAKSAIARLEQQKNEVGAW